MNIRFTIGMLFILFGLLAFLGIDVGRIIGPLFLVLIGWFILKGRRCDMNISDINTDMVSEESAVNEVVVFSDAKRKITSPDFRGGKIVSVFSGADIDLTEAKTKRNVVDLELVSVLAGLTLTIPRGWRVNLNTVGILGGVDNKTQPTGKGPELRVKSAAILGGIMIRN